MTLHTKKLFTKKNVKRLLNLPNQKESTLNKKLKLPK